MDLPGTDWPRESEASGVMMIPVPHSGVLEKVDGEEEARATPGVTELHITARLHDYIARMARRLKLSGFPVRKGANARRSRESPARTRMQNCDLPSRRVSR